MRNIIGYFLGFVIFIAGVPALMWWASGQPQIADSPLLRLVAAVVVAVAGIALSVWSIVHMRRVGKGNPFDAVGHEVAPRTKHLMTDGPYRFSRNPMLSGTYVYYIGVALAFFSWQSLAVFVVVVALMTIQVISEEKRLERDFGDEYLQYKKKTRRFF